MTPFDTFLSQLRTTNLSLADLCDFSKIKQNTEQMRVKLATLNALIGSQNLAQTVKAIFTISPKAFEALPILLALRPSGVNHEYLVDGEILKLQTLLTTEEGIMTILDKSGLGNVLSDRSITNLHDYVFGVETGLDSNARKNRGGHAMERIIVQILSQSGVKYRSEVYSHELPGIKEELGKDEKRFDFMIETSCTKYLLEVNFYNTPGSKLNEVARAYSELSPRINKVKGYQFVWITDGQGWHGAKTKLAEAFAIIPHIYNLTTFAVFLKNIAEG